ncbi:UNKNOWN [Stylonychia lemnae]|uniref:Uncharacterized protein n=1 Tax=Stylonychia lemnae TaxID=5949 RepID=A0A077ZUR6_STYLE|nr:UNKNOWN [Stylonychia lemnae]|eukprot:CDW73642.1 UNKNOWN [Stylonychia lemnae]
MDSIFPKVSHPISQDFLSYHQQYQSPRIIPLQSIGQQFSSISISGQKQEHYNCQIISPSLSFPSVSQHPLNPLIRSWALTGNQTFLEHLKREHPNGSAAHSLHH